ncbi:MAG TPA: hypothetical protein VM911_11890 [Pyrinomonadaceae bacterium]|jgi:hypothetical protein|nr:hypothetical protein [Pyrinomonadaceae bacterium]
MNKHISIGESVANRDIYVGDPVLNLCPELKPLLDNKTISHDFAAIDKVARHRKYVFTTLGTISLILVCAVLILLAWKLALALIDKEYPGWLETLSAGMGVVAVGIQVYLSFSGLHEKWIYARFMAERMRLWKFQILLDGQFISSGVSKSPDQFTAELKQRWELFKEEFKHGIGGMDEVVATQPPELLVEPTPYSDPRLLDKVRQLFILLRLNVQISHYEGMNRQLEPKDKLTDSWSKVLLGLSGLIAIIEACIVVIHLSGQPNSDAPSNNLTTAVLAGLALSFAIASAAIRVYRGATMLVEERERYLTKQAHLKRIKDRFARETDSHKILLLMEETENVCNEELQDFIRALRRADYFF